MAYEREGAPYKLKKLYTWISENLVSQPPLGSISKEDIALVYVYQMATQNKVGLQVLLVPYVFQNNCQG